METVPVKSDYELPCFNCVFEYWCNWNKLDENHECNDFKSIGENK